MKITKLNLINFRDARDLSLELDPKLNVFFGVNGSGKSTVLDAIAIMLSWVVSRIGRSEATGRQIMESDITNDKSTSSIQLFCEADSRPIEWRLSKNRKGYATSEDKSYLHDLTNYTKGIQTKISETSERVNLPLFVYYPVNRAVLDIPFRIRGQHKFDLLTAYNEALTSSANFRTFFEWFREREDLENERFREYHNEPIESIDKQFTDLQLKTVRIALNIFLPDFSNLTVRRSPLRMEVEKNGKRLTVNQLSGGEKSLIAMIGDLARRMAIANPASTEPLLGSGIVLIDEIDLHLHPKWQRMIVINLLKVFPNCQFIISTHSPHVITNIQPESLFDLKQTDLGIVAVKPNESYGKNVDRILEDLMGLETTRPDEVDSDLGRIFSNIDAGRLDDAKKMIAELKHKIGADPDLVKAEVLIKRRELIDK
ncbi:DNA double-strand break repair Rad50 ATPase [uncultured archaeon]|nr:DNA double-strand break repair Rad50 ATPase [uncultured archaeon]